MGLLRRLHGLLQRGVDLESGRLLGRRAHHRAAHVHVLLQCIDVRAHQPDSGTNDDHCSPNSGTHVDNLTCANASAYAGTNAGAYARADASTDPGTDASAYAGTNAGAYARADASTDPGTNAGAYAGTDDGHYGTDAGTHVDVQL